MRDLLLDFRLAFRILSRNRRHTVAAVLLLGLGLAGVVTVGALLQAVLAEPLPYAAPERLVMVWPVQQDGRAIGEDFSIAELADLQTRVDGFEAVGGLDYRHFTVSGREEVERLLGARVSAGMFEALGAPPMLGRPIGAAEDVPGGDAVAVLGFQLWQRHFAGDPAVIGSSIRLDDRSRTVIGVMGPDFQLPTDYRTLERSQVWVPLAEETPDPAQRAGKELEGVVARLRPGVSSDRVQAELDGLHARLVAEFPDSYQEGPVGLLATSPHEDAVSSSRSTLLLLLAALAGVLLVAVVNVAVLTLARGRHRRREISLRGVLGAGFWRINRQLAAEGALIGFAAALAALLGSSWALPMAVRRLASDIPRAGEAVLGADLIWGTLAVGLLAGVVTALLPGLRAGRIRPDVLRGAGSDGSRLWWRHGPLVAGQITLTVVLVAGAGLLLTSFWRLNRTELGFVARDSVLTFQLSFPRYDYPDHDSVTRAIAEVLDRIRNDVAVEEAGAVRRRPLADQLGTWSMVVETDQGEVRPASFPAWQVVTPGFFGAIGIGLRQGRLLSEADLDGAVGPVVINASMAGRYWPGEDAVGRRFRLDGSRNNPWLEVVGVVGDVLHEGAAAAPQSTFYVPLPHWPRAVGFGTNRTVGFVVRSRLQDADLRAAIRSRVRQVDPALPLVDVATTEEIVAESVALPRRLATLLALLAALTLTLSCAGIYSTASLVAAARLPEIGIRMALGADSGGIVVAFLGRALAVAAVGIGAGVVVTLLGGRLLAGFLFGVSPTDPAVLLVTAAAVLATCLAATWVPARRAAGADPLAVLRRS